MKRVTPQPVEHENPEVAPGTIVVLLENAIEKVQLGDGRSTSVIHFHAGAVVFVEDARRFGARFTLEGVDGRRPPPRETRMEAMRVERTRSTEPDTTEATAEPLSKPWSPADRASFRDERAHEQERSRA